MLYYILQTHILYLFNNFYSLFVLSLQNNEHEE